MGITGLLPLLKPVTKDTHVRELKGLTVGIDTYCWLHKGIYSCSAELCQGIPTDKFIKYCVERVHLLLAHGVKPYLVFDGGYLPAKAGKEAERRAKREANMQRGMQLLREGNSSGAHQLFCKAADVTPFMAHQLIQVLKRIPGVKYVVAPYEADAQLGFLARNGHVDCVITEDSDIILFGCSRVLFKLDRDGAGQEVDLRDVFSRRNDELDMRGMTEDDLMTVCALSGCDYLPSVHGVGLKKAHRLVARHKQLPKILRAVKFEASGGFPPGYEVEFHRALLTFRHQRAFDPVTRKVVHMTPLPDTLPDILTAQGAGDNGADLLDFLGPTVEEERGCAVADAEIDPITGERFSEMASNWQSRKGDIKEAPETGLSDSAAAALASWRGATSNASGGAKGGRGRATGGRSSSSKPSKLCGQGNNLTKYWGAPLPQKSPAGAASAGGDKSVGGNVGRRRSRREGYDAAEQGSRAVDSSGGTLRAWGSGDGSTSTAADRTFEEEQDVVAATPPRVARKLDRMDVDRSCGEGGESGDMEGAVREEGEGGGAAGTPEEAGFGRPQSDAKADPDASGTLGLHSPSPMSPDGFYGDFSPSPQKALITPEAEDPSEGDAEKENRDPSLPSAADKQTSPHETGTSKHFFGGSGGSGGSGSGGASSGGSRRLSRGKRAVSSAAGLRKRFRSPLVDPSSASRAAGATSGGKLGEASKSTGGCPASGGGGGGGGSDDCGNNTGIAQTNPWKADFLFSSRTGTRSLESTALAESGDGASVGGGGDGRGLKRRRTLGVGSVAPKGLLRGLDGVAAAGGGLAARRSKSLGGGVTNGTSSTQRGGFDVSTEPDGHSVDNLFERFARIPNSNTAAAGGIHTSTESASGVSTSPPAHSAASVAVPVDGGTWVNGGITRVREIGSSSAGDGDDDVGGGACGSDNASCDESREVAMTATNENNMRSVPRDAQAGNGVGGGKSPAEEEEEDPCVLSARSVNVGLGSADGDNNDAGSIARRDTETSTGGAGGPTKGTGPFVGQGYVARSDSKRKDTAAPELVAGQRETFRQERGNGENRGRRGRSERLGRGGGGSVRKVDPDVQDIFARFMYTVP